MMTNTQEGAPNNIGSYTLEQYISGEIELPPTSILLVKPEISLMSPESIELLFGLIDEVTQTYGQIVDPFWVKLDRESAHILWMSDICSYGWAEDYCAYMASAPCLVFALHGDASAFIAKKYIRREMVEIIGCLQTVLGSEFQPDIVHGSDEDDGHEEFLIFGKHKID